MRQALVRFQALTVPQARLSPAVETAAMAVLGIPILQVTVVMAAMAVLVVLSAMAVTAVMVALAWQSETA